jgi:hypothetical protein
MATDSDLTGKRCMLFADMARFRSAARLAPQKDVEIGGYIVGRTSTHREIKLKTLSLTAGGSKNIRYYTFGPECACATRTRVCHILLTSRILTLRLTCVMIRILIGAHLI